MEAFGTTRSRVAARHAFLAPDGHVRAPQPGWQGAETSTLISPQVGTKASARFTMTLAWLEPGGQAGPPLAGVERFVYALGGAVTLQTERGAEALGPHHYAYLPPGATHELVADEAARLVLFERRYVTLPGTPLPEPMVGDARALEGEPFLGDEGVRVRRLLPSGAAYDLAVNTMTFRPGASLPFVETHANEHGLLMLSGGGIYRLEDDWYPIRAGDALWMGPYCPQWFGALGAEDGSYLLYKDQNRDWLAFDREG